jgi:carbon storage regulator CsrA
MLVLTGKPGDVISIGSDIELVFFENRYHPDYFKIGIKAPIEINILRASAKVKVPKPKE